MRKVSVIVPVYGVERFIEQCARSLFEQTYEDIEYVFVDDCTQDNSVAVLQETIKDYPDRIPQFRLCQHETNRGSGAARLTGMQNATGELVMFVDSDDYIDSECVEKLVARQEETGTDIVDSAYATFSDDKVLSTTHPWIGGKEKSYLQSILIHNTVTHQLWARIIRRSLFEEAGVSFIEGIDHGEDYSVMARLLLTAKRETIDDVLYYYRYNDYGTFADGISKRHITSFLRANGVVCSYIMEHDKGKVYDTALQIGLLHTYHCALKVGVSVAEVGRYCPVPSRLFARVGMLLARASLRRVLRWYYLIVKKVYKVFVLHLRD